MSRRDKNPVNDVLTELARGIGRSFVRSGTKALDSFLEDAQITVNGALDKLEETRHKVRGRCEAGTMGCAVDGYHETPACVVLKSSRKKNHK